MTRSIRGRLSKDPMSHAQGVDLARECTFSTHEKSYKSRNPPRWAHNRTLNGSGHRDAHNTNTLLDKTHNVIDFAGTSSGEGQDQAQTQPSAHGLEPQSMGHVSPAASFSDRMVSTVTTNSSEALNLLFNTAQGDSVQSANAVPNAEPKISRASTGDGVVILCLSEPDDEVLDLWDKFRFVRQGWLTAQEAVTYIDLFYLHIAPLASVKLDAFRSHRSHARLVHEEPMLCSTMLMISSRLFTLPGSGGVSRSHNNHRRIWNYCEHLLQRVILGQEKQSTARIRVLGTIESLLLISDWPPRAINLPPETEGWDSELISPGYDRYNRRRNNDDAPLIRWREDVFEPAKRSERMSWMLFGVAMNLAHELGLFAEDGTPDNTDPEQQARRWRLRKLLYVYATQAALRMRVPSILPDHIAYAISQPHPSSQTAPDAKWNAFIHSWIELTKLSSTASAMFFQSPVHTKTQLINGSYAPILDHLLASFRTWHEAIIHPGCVSEVLRTVLLIEYHHLKACTTAIATQAVVEKAAASSHSGQSRSSEGFLTYTSAQDAKFLKEVISDASEVLRIASSSEFKHAIPYVATRLRTYVVSSSVFLLKAICVGSSNTEVLSALKIIEESSTALQLLAPDDMCFASRSAALIEKHTRQLRSSLVPTATGGFGKFIDNHPMGIANTPLTHDGFTHMDNFPEFDALDCSADKESTDWLTLPYDHGIAPFNSSSEQVSFGFELESLDFLWNLAG